MRTVRMCLVLASVLAVSVLVSPTGRAEHLPDHRYFVVGTITDELGQPLCGVTVRAADITKPSPDNNRTATTDWSGNYRIQLHMHDSFDIESNQPRSVHNVNDQIRVSVEGSGASAIVIASKNSENPEGWGQQRVDLLAEGLRSPSLCLAQVALIGAGVVVVVIAVFAVVVLVPRARLLGRRRGSRAALAEVPGVSRVRARELEGFGIRTVEDLAAAKPEEIASGTTLTPKQARLLVKRANEALGDKS